jgi:hypothetical protein
MVRGMNDDKTRDYYLNPNYGGGATRRRVRLTSSPGAVEGRLADIAHELRCRVEHQDGVITHVTGETIRVPTSVCPGAVAALQELVGLPTSTDSATFYAGGRARRHCTHLFHLAVLCVAQSGRDEVTRVYDIIVPDETDSPIEVMVSRNDVPVHRWTVRAGRIVAPPELADRPLLSGFSLWAGDAFSGDALEAANVLAQGYFISQARRYDTEAAAGKQLAADSPMIGVCFAYAPERFATGRFVGGSSRDFTDAVVETE